MDRLGFVLVISLLQTVYSTTIDLSRCPVGVTRCPHPVAEPGPNCIVESLSKQTEYRQCLEEKLEALVASEDCNLCRKPHFQYLVRNLGVTNVEKLAQISCWRIEKKGNCKAKECESLIGTKGDYRLTRASPLDVMTNCTDKMKTTKNAVMRCLEDFDGGKMKISGCDRLFQWKIANMGYLYLRNIKAMCQGCPLTRIRDKCIDDKPEIAKVFFSCSDAEKMEVHYACVKEEMTKYSTCAGWPRKAVDAHFTKLRNF